jgi:hypothetical protein
MPTFSRTGGRAARLSWAAPLLVASVALTGCSQLAPIVEQILPERSGAHTLLVGECFNDTVTMPTAPDAVVDVPRQNCTLDHDNEVIASVQLDGESFPGDEAVAVRGQEACQPEFEAFIGVGFDQAGTLGYDFFVPTVASWELGDREILCFAFNSAGPTAYSLRDRGAEAPEPADATTESKS